MVETGKTGVHGEAPSAGGGDDEAETGKAGEAEKNESVVQAEPSDNIVLSGADAQSKPSDNIVPSGGSGDAEGGGGGMPSCSVPHGAKDQEASQNSCFSMYVCVCACVYVCMCVRVRLCA